MKWQPIETAPKGKKVLVFGLVPGYAKRMTMIARFWPQHTLEVAEGYEDEDWVDLSESGNAYMPADWYEEVTGEDIPAIRIVPTHWMPLPPPPEEDKTTTTKISKEWCIRMALAEEGMEIGAGLTAIDPVCDGPLEEEI